MSSYSPYNNPDLPLFHNTTDLPDKEVQQREKKAENQNARVLQVFSENPFVDFTPWDVYYRLGQQHPLTSVRRAITNLTNLGYLEKGKDKRVPRNGFGEVNYTWRLKR